MKRLHLLCNAHLDPYWQWEWEEGAAEALSTFRTAADFCEAYPGFIFNHNEVILYKWIEEYEPALFQRIQRLVVEGKWRIMGGWYLQPDCNMPSGESFVRQALVGRLYFKEKFGVEPRTAINFDPFGHTRGLVQILKKSGYDSYIHCRPDQHDCPLPDNDYIWVGYDGSEINGHRTLSWYGTPCYGMARKKVEDDIAKHGDRPIMLVTWGVGNHGGGPSRRDLDDLKALMAAEKDWEIVHSAAEDYFTELRALGNPLPRHEQDLNSWGVGCYTSQVRLKQKHRLLENELYATEKMCAVAALNGLMEYPRETLHAALCDLLVAEFHDILPGSSIQPVEEAGVRLMDHALEILSRIKAKAFFALASGQAKAKEGEIPVLAYNPHPFAVEGIFEVEFNVADIGYGENFITPMVFRDGNPLPCQTEKEHGNLNLCWRKRVVFHASLEPGRVNRFDCTTGTATKGRTRHTLVEKAGRFEFTTGNLEVVVNTRTGLIDRYVVNGVDQIRPGAFLARVMRDNEDPWSMETQTYRDEAGVFALMDAEAATRFSGVREATLPAVRVIEDGPVRTVVEACFRYADSFLLLHYKLPKIGTEVQVDVRVQWNEKDRALKLAIPSAFGDSVYHGQVAYGRDVLPGDKKEVVAQQWVAAVSPGSGQALSVINSGSYGSDFVDQEIRLTLLRSASYAGHPIEKRPIVQQDRYTPRIDQGERLFRFWMNGGEAQARMDRIDREAIARNEAPMMLSFFPSGAGMLPKGGPQLDDGVAQMTCFKQAERSNHYILRLFEPTGEARSTRLRIPVLGVDQTIALGRFEIKSFLIDPETGTLEEVDLTERPL